MAARIARRTLWPTPLCRAGLLTGLEDYVVSLGGSFARVLERAGLEEEEISNPNYFIPLEKECAVQEEAAYITGHPALMVEVSNKQTLGHPGPREPNDYFMMRERSFSRVVRWWAEWRSSPIPRHLVYTGDCYRYNPARPFTKPLK